MTSANRAPGDRVRTIIETSRKQWSAERAAPDMEQAPARGKFRGMMVEKKGIEPSTSALRTRRSPS